jgi:uncharacterized protein (DUF2384 family)
MTAVLDSIVDLSHPAAAAREVAQLNARLVAEPTIPDEVSAGVREIALAIQQTGLAHWEAIDPRHAVVLLQSEVIAQRALDKPDSPVARDELRIALESMRQALAAIAEREPVSDERSPKELVRWLAEVTEVPQAQLAELLGVSTRQFQRWVSPTELSQPEGEDARRVRAVARIVNQLRFVLTPAGAIAWFDWPRSDLGGRTPTSLLSDPQQLPELLAAAGSMRGAYAG